MDQVEARIEELVGRLDLEAKVRLCTGASVWATWDEPAVGLRALALSDGPAGVRGDAWDERRPSTNLPSPTCMAASWDEDLVERLGRFLAAEARAKGVDVLLGPTIPEPAVDDKVRRLLRLASRVGALEDVEPGAADTRDAATRDAAAAVPAAAVPAAAVPAAAVPATAVPGVAHPDPSVSGPPVGERSRSPGSRGPAVHSPHPMPGGSQPRRRLSAGRSVADRPFTADITVR
jgi:beta-glucosidase-like glycosyl hydrolase